MPARWRGKRSSKIHELLGDNEIEQQRQKGIVDGGKGVGTKRDRQREARKRDGIGAILEEVINRCESKIDLFCSGSRPGDEPEGSVSASPRTHIHSYVHISMHRRTHCRVKDVLARTSASKERESPALAFYARMSPG